MAGGLRSIRTRITLLLILVVTFVYGVFAIIEIENRTAELEAELGDNAESLLDFQAHALSIPLWNFDRNEIHRQLQLFAANPDVAAASVTQEGNFGFADITVTVDDNAAQLARIQESDLPNLEKSTRQAKSRADIQEVYTLKHAISNEGETIGWLVVDFSLSRIVAIRADVIATHLRQFLIITAAVALTIAAAVTSLVRPILHITQAMQDIAAGDLDLAIPATDRDDEIGKMACALGVFKANAKTLKVALDKERELNSLQRQFVAMVSHEFRTPLAIIDGNAQRLARRAAVVTPENLHGAIAKIRGSVVRLTNLMESVLSSSSLEDGKIECKLADCDLAALLHDICSSYRGLNAGHRIIDDIVEPLPTITADEKLLRQTFSNLVSNAIKYAPEETTIWINAQLGDRGDVVVTVRDEGVGIPEQEQKRLFERFFRASTSTGIPGTGIGLHLVKHLIDMHGGSIAVESNPGKGAEFSVRLPIKQPVIAGQARDHAGIEDDVVPEFETSTAA